MSTMPDAHDDSVVGSTAEHILRAKLSSGKPRNELNRAYINASRCEEHLQEHDAHAINVGCVRRIMRARPIDDFRRNIAWCSTGAVLSTAATRPELCDPKVDEDNVSRLIYHNVLGFDIAMEDPMLVQRVQGQDLTKVREST